MQATEQAMDLVFPLEVSSISYSWNFPPSVQQDNGLTHGLDFYFASPPSSPTLEANHPHKSSISDVSDSSQQESLGTYPLIDDFTSGHSSVSYASSVHSEDFWVAESTGIDTAEVPSSATSSESKTIERRHRRREQNRKAQSNFRQKRKDEVRSLQHEVEELRAQVAAFHKRGPTANLTICTKCRTFYPAAAAGALHVTHQSVNSELFS